MPRRVRQDGDGFSSHCIDGADGGEKTGFAAHGHIRKYDGEPFMPHHIVEAVKAQLAGNTRLSIPVHEVNA